MNEKVSRRDVIRTGAAAGVAAALSGAGAGQAAAQGPPGTPDDGALTLVNGKIHTIDADNTVASAVSIRNGRIVAVGTSAANPGPGGRVINLKGRTVVPGIIDAHNHIVLVGNRPGWHTLAEHVFTIPELIELYQARGADVPPGEFITTIGPLAARQLEEQRLPVLSELDAVDRPIYIQAAQGGTRTNSEGREWLEARGVVVDDDGAIGGGGTGSSLALQLLREELLTPETRERSALDALQYFTSLGITTHGDSGAFHADEPAGGIATENTFTMHNPFLALNREERIPARLRIDFLHQDDPNSDLPTLTERLKNSFQFFGNDWLRTGGIGEFTSQPAGVPPLRAIAEAGWRAEDHALNPNAAATHIANREIVHAEIPIDQLRWRISHVFGFTEELADRFHAIGGGVLVGGSTPTRAEGALVPPFRMLVDHPIQVGWHSDGGDITVISPWLQLFTMITGRNLSGDHIVGDQTVTRQEALWLATAANKWFTAEDDVGSIEVGNHADLVVLDRDYFAVPDEELRRITSVLTIVGGRLVHDTGEVR